MPLKILLFFVFLIFSLTHFSAQNYIFGDVSNESGQKISSVLIVNMKTQQKTLSSSDGYFSIMANVGDELRFVRQNYERVSLKVGTNNSTSFLNVTMVNIPIEIEELDLGFRPSGDLAKDSKRLNKIDKIAQLQSDIGLPKPVDKPREKPSEVGKDILSPLLSLTPSVNVQAIYNVISGRARKQKRLYKYQDSQEKIVWLQTNLKTDFFDENKIPEIKISDFLSYALLENAQLRQAVGRKNKDKAEFLLLELVPKYLNLGK